MKKVLVIGADGAGKDTFADILSKATGLSYDSMAGSTSRAILYKHFAQNVTNLTDLEEIYRNRRNNREEWFEAGERLRNQDKCALLRWCFNRGDIATGVRTIEEIEEAKKQTIVDVILWVERPGYVSKTFGIGFQHDRLVDSVIMNDENIDGLVWHAHRVAYKHKLYSWMQ